MRVLLDECVPVQLAQELRGHEVDTVTGLGWKGVRNGELLGRAALAYDTFMTVDRRMASEHNLPPRLALVTLRVRSNRIGSLLPLVPAILQRLESVQPGESIEVSA